MTRMIKRCVVCLLSIGLLLAIACTSYAQIIRTGLDDPVPDDAVVSDLDSYVYKIFLPLNEEPSNDGYLLNLLSEDYPGYGTNLTKAQDTSNGTQWFTRRYVTLNGHTYYMWSTYNDISFSINCRRVNTTGSYVNVVPIIHNNCGDLNIHSPVCFGATVQENENQGSHFLAAAARDMQTSIMVICATGEPTGYTNNTYLKWGIINVNPTPQHALIYRIGYGYLMNGVDYASCLH